MLRARGMTQRESLIHCTAVAAEAVRCFSCTVKTPSRRKMVKAAEIGGENATGALASSDHKIPTAKRLCSKFDGSERFAVDCPLSTLCKTRTFHLHTHTGSPRAIVHSRKTSVGRSYVSSTLRVDAIRKNAID